MMKKTLFVILGIILISAIVYAAESKIYIDYNFMGNDIFNATWVNASNFSGGIDCSNIVGSPDTDFCTDTGASESDPYWSGNYSAFNDSWSTTYNSTYDTASANNSWNETRASLLYSPLSEPLWAGNYSAFNDSWSSVYNSSYMTSYSEYDPAWAANYSLYNTSWSTDTDTKFIAGNGLTLIGTTFSFTQPRTENLVLSSKYNITGVNYSSAVHFYQDGNIVCDDSNNCAYISAEVDPAWATNYSSFNDSWAMTYNSSYDALIGTAADNTSWNETYAVTLFSPIGEPLWSGNYSTFNSSWSRTYNSTYDTILTANVSNVSNSSFFWDNLDSPSDINAGDITDDGTYLTSYSEYDPAWATNYSAFNDSWATTWNATYDAYIVSDSAGLWDALDTPADINTADITDDDTYVTVAGDIMGGTLDMNTETIDNVGQINVDYVAGATWVNTSGFNYSGCGANQVLKVSGINWACAADADTADTTCDSDDGVCTFDDDTLALLDLTYTGSLLWGNVSGYDLNVDWSGGGTLGGGNITADSLSGTQIAELTDADISNTLTCSALTDDDTYALVAGETFTGDVTVTGWMNATDVNASTAVYTNVVCMNSTCGANITYNGSSIIIYS